MNKKNKFVMSAVVTMSMILTFEPIVFAFDSVMQDPKMSSAPSVSFLTTENVQSPQEKIEKNTPSTDFLSDDGAITAPSSSFGDDTESNGVLLRTYEVRRPDRTVEAYSDGAQLILRDVNTDMTVSFSAPGVQDASQITQIHNLLVMRTRDELLVINLHTLSREKGEPTQSNSSYILFESNLPILTLPSATKSYYNVISEETGEVVATYSKHEAGKNGEIFPVIKPDVAADGSFVTYSARFVYAGTGGRGGFTYFYSKDLNTGLENPVLSISSHIDLQTDAVGAAWQTIGGQQHYGIHFSDGTQVIINLEINEVVQVKKIEKYENGNIKREVTKYFENNVLTLTIEDSFTETSKHLGREMVSYTDGLVVKRQNVNYDLETGEYVNWVSTTYDSQARRLEQRIWKRTPQGVMLSYEQVRFNPDSGLKLEQTSVAYDHEGRKNKSWYQTFHTNGKVKSSTTNFINVVTGLTYQSSTYFYTDSGDLYRWIGKTFYESGKIKTLDDRYYQNRIETSREYIIYDESGNRIN